MMRIGWWLSLLLNITCMLTCRLTKVLWNTGFFVCVVTNNNPHKIACVPLAQMCLAFVLHMMVVWQTITATSIGSMSGTAQSWAHYY